MAMLSVDETQLMGQALEMAEEALAAGDQPFGAVAITPLGTAADRNRVYSANDPTAHSEVMAIRHAAAKWGVDCLHDSLLVTSYEPCPIASVRCSRSVSAE